MYSDVWIDGFSKIKSLQKMSAMPYFIETNPLVYVS